MLRLGKLIKWAPVLLIFLLGAFLRFYKLNWGENYFFHPDEYHIAAAVERISFPTNLNPHLFSYGSFSVYLIYFSKSLLSFLNASAQKTSPFLIGRFYSALFSFLTIVNIYLISKKLFKNKLAVLLSAFLVAITPGLVQQAHFLTPEATVTFWITLTLYFWIRWLDNKRSPFLYLSAVALGVASSTKITAGIILPILIILPFIKSSKKSLSKLITSVKLSITWFIFHFIFFPFSILDSKGFVNSLNYEGAVARGKMLVFYTRQFVGTKPILFQISKILPYSLGVALLIFAGSGLILSIINQVLNLIKGKKADIKLLIVLLTFLLIFLPNSLLFAKWTRFINPTFPFFSLFAAIFITKVSNFLKDSINKKILFNILSLAIIIPTSIWTIMFFSIYTRRDVRIVASNWVNNNIVKDSFILTETGNTLEVPLFGGYKKIAFDFYNLDNSPKLQNQLIQYLSSSDYFIIQSRRIFMNEQGQVSQFPITSNFYSLLFSGKLGFEEIAEFNSFPSLKIKNLKFEINDERAEETWSVFDHPVIRIYKKVNSYPVGYYAQILKI